MGCDGGEGVTVTDVHHDEVTVIYVRHDGRGNADEVTVIYVHLDVERESDGEVTVIYVHVGRASEYGSVGGPHGQPTPWQRALSP